MGKACIQFTKMIYITGRKEMGLGVKKRGTLHLTITAHRNALDQRKQQIALIHHQLQEVENRVYMSVGMFFHIFKMLQEKKPMHKNKPESTHL